jgi:thymidylate synthase
MIFLFNTQFVVSYSNITEQPTMESEQKYLQILQHVIEHGIKNGKNLSVPGETFKFPLFDDKNGKPVIPALTTKPVLIKTALKELLWFISGSTITKELHDKEVHIWDEFATRVFLDSRGLKKQPEGELGPIYGYQWRNWNGFFDPDLSGSASDDASAGASADADASEPPASGSASESEDDVDQLTNVIENLKKNPLSQQHIVITWNPEQIAQMAVPPTHYAFQFVVHPLPVIAKTDIAPKYKYEVHCIVTVRSADVFSEVPYIAVQYAFLTHMITHLIGMKPGSLTINVADASVAESHVKKSKVQIARAPKCEAYPWLQIMRAKAEIEDGIDGFTAEDFKIKNYKNQGPLKDIK